ncbi:uncharacterized protein MELLADRAFT_110759 [Melampsora larici-populina 98AG31]|uniref:Uncharacterized protein n=1 Tax=Melampsora larici-populina (strain 98AG31 / pathotype 3-4-7) TaxID=747676 RepID=F4S0V4_MELLP|nr:uncharacterized protein MELLADRAFT_110759 [Melampsora larici-populina 98AG31]EGG01746.1 hypothetical protein MELLADRAFT_110759 [Melampsora larici-populina 98AG31]
MSTPSDINQFNAIVKRSSDRIRGNSASPTDQPGDANTDAAGSTADGPMTANANTNTPGPAGCKGSKGKKASNPTGSQPGPNTSSYATTAEGQSSAEDTAAGSSVKDQGSQGVSQGISTNLDANSMVSPEGASATTAGTAATAPASTLAPTSAPTPTTVLLSNPVNGGNPVGQTAPLIAPEVLNRGSFLAGTNAILSRIDECSPDTTREWLQSKGYSLVPTCPTSAAKEAVKTGAVNQPASRVESRSSSTTTKTTPAPQDQVVCPPVTSTGPAPAATSATTTQNHVDGAQVATVAASKKRAPPEEVFDLTADDESPTAEKATTTTSTISRLANNSGGSGYNKPTHRSQSFSHQQSYTTLPVYDGPGGSSSNTFEERRPNGRNFRTRGRRGSWGGNQGNGDRSPQCRCFNGNNDSWRRDDRREDRNGEDRDNAGPSGKAK